MEQVAEHLPLDLMEPWDALSGTEQAAMLDVALGWDIDRMTWARAYYWCQPGGREDLQVALSLATLESGVWSELSEWAECQ